MFLGQYYHNIDEKGRLTIPARFRELLSEGAFVTQGFDQNLMVLTAPNFNALSEAANSMSLTDENARFLKRLLFSTAERIVPDKNGRILVPNFLRGFANLTEEAVLVGAGAYFEIWAPPVWEGQLVQLQDSDANAKRFSDLNLTANQT